MILYSVSLSKIVMASLMHGYQWWGRIFDIAINVQLCTIEILPQHRSIIETLALIYMSASYLFFS